MKKTWDLFYVVISKNSYTDTFTPSVPVFGDRDCKKVIKVKWSHKDGPLIQLASAFIRAELRTPSAIWGHSNKIILCKPRKELSPGADWLEIWSCT